MQLPTQVTLVEVGARDGLQNETTFVPTDIKIEFINRLSQTGLTQIEVTSFVSPKKIPQLQDGTEVLRGIDAKTTISYPVLVPNIKGLHAAVAAGAKTIAIFASASQSFSQRNINCSIAESLTRYRDVITQAREKHLSIRGYISCCLGCPYEGKIDPEIVTDIAAKLYALGCYEISLGDTIGVGTPRQAVNLIDHVSQQVPINHLAGHFHDTYGQALANIYACLQKGMTTFDSSVSGLGGCPYAKGATGNVATEDVLYMMQGLGIETGIDLQKLLDAGNYINQFLQRQPDSKVARVLK